MTYSCFFHGHRHHSSALRISSRVGPHTFLPVLGVIKGDLRALLGIVFLPCLHTFHALAFLELSNYVNSFQKLSLLKNILFGCAFLDPRERCGPSCWPRGDYQEAQMLELRAPYLYNSFQGPRGGNPTRVSTGWHVLVKWQLSSILTRIAKMSTSFYSDFLAFTFLLVLSGLGGGKRACWPS